MLFINLRILVGADNIIPTETDNTNGVEGIFARLIIRFAIANERAVENRIHPILDYMYLLLPLHLVLFF